MIAEINESVKVNAVFSKGAINIRSLSWNNRIVPVKKTTYRWQSRKGVFPIYHFAVSDGTSIFELTFEPVVLQWKLEKIHSDG